MRGRGIFNQNFHIFILHQIRYLIIFVLLLGKHQRCDVSGKMLPQQEDHKNEQNNGVSQYVF